MGKRAKAKRSVSQPAARPVEPRAKPNWSLLAVSAAGIALTGYLAWTAFHGADVKGCAVGGGCDVVLTSRWATLMGMPTSFWGLLTYLALGLTAVMPQPALRWKLGWIGALFGLVYSIYLTTVSLTILKAACPYCLTSLTLMTAIFALTSYQRPAQLLNFSWFGMLKWSLPPAIAIILILHLNYVGVFGNAPTEENPIARALASYLKDNGVKFYGAYWCPHCQDQKALFGLSASRLPYIECSPGGQNAPQAKECNDANIKTYPTWIINGKRTEEVMSLQQLAQSTGFQERKP